MMDSFKHVQAAHTHNCPQCNSATVCDLEKGKSSCWCFQMPAAATAPSFSAGERCLCRQCLLQRRQQPSE